MQISRGVARRRHFDVVMIWAFDRMARSVRHFLDVLDEPNRLNIEFICFRENIDTGGPWAAPWLSSWAPSPNWNAT
jgi:hypothetical protein